MLGKNISVERGENVLFEEYRFFFYITIDSQLTPDEIVGEARQRCNQENLIAQLKGGARALHAAVNTVNANWAYMTMASAVPRQLCPRPRAAPGVRSPHRPTLGSRSCPERLPEAGERRRISAIDDELFEASHAAHIAGLGATCSTSAPRHRRRAPRPAARARPRRAHPRR